MITNKTDDRFRQNGFHKNGTKDGYQFYRNRDTNQIGKVKISNKVQIPTEYKKSIEDIEDIEDIIKEDVNIINSEIRMVYKPWLIKIESALSDVYYTNDNNRHAIELKQDITNTKLNDIVIFKKELVGEIFGLIVVAIFQLIVLAFIAYKCFF